MRFLKHYTKSIWKKEGCPKINKFVLDLHHYVRNEVCIVSFMYLAYFRLYQLHYDDKAIPYVVYKHSYFSYLTQGIVYFSIMSTCPNPLSLLVYYRLKVGNTCSSCSIGLVLFSSFKVQSASHPKLLCIST